MFSALLNYRYSAEADAGRNAVVWEGITSLGGEERTNYPVDMSVDDLGDGFDLVAQVRRDIGADRVNEFMNFMLHQLVEVLGTDGWEAPQDIRCIGARFPSCVQYGTDLGSEMNGISPPWISIGIESRSALSHKLSFCSVFSLIHQHACHSPQRTAVVMGDDRLSYAELDRRSSRLAAFLARRGVERGCIVGVGMGRGPKLLVTLLAVLKSGAAYLPLDASYPADRLRFMIGDSGMSHLVYDDVLDVVSMDPVGPRLLCWQDMDLEDGPNEEDFVVPVRREDLAYVIYTSGSTGTPKGVMVEHGPLAMHCQAVAEIYEMGPQSCEFHFMSFSFDGAHERWLTALCSGARLVLRDDELWTPDTTLDILHRERVTVAAFPPAYLMQLADAAQASANPPPVEVYCFGGEAMPAAGYDKVRKTLKPLTLINGYGPTETVVTPLIWKTAANQPIASAYAPIGKAVGQRTLHVLDANLRQTPAGVVGELYVGGEGLARGYLKRPALTAERFVADPFSETGGRLYRTGDLVRVMADGNIEYVGRVDDQVKVRGFRIELGEVEASLREVSGVLEAAAVVQEGVNGAQIVAYVVPDQAMVVINQPLIQAAFSKTIRQHLGERLPDYMVPAHLVMMASLPRLTSGKLDRKALPLPATNTLSARVHVEPSTAEARQLADIWEDVLGVPQVGETDNFFELGGDSLLSLKVLTRVRALANPRLSFKLRDLIQKPTIGALLGIQPTVTGQADEGLMLLNAGSDASASALFCIHAGMGTIFDYQPLARALHGVRPMYGLSCRMLLDSTHYDRSLDQMAQDYVTMIRTIQTSGPYHLLGWSLGGTLVALMTRILEDAGDEVRFLGMVDPFVPAGDSGARADDWQMDLFDYLSVMFELTDEERVSIELQEKSVDDGQLTEALVGEWISTLLNKGIICAIKSGGVMDAAEHARIFMVARHLKALSTTLPALPALRKRAHCWWAESRSASDRAVLWQQLEQAPGSEADVPTDHFTIMRHEEFIRDLKACLSGLDDVVHPNQKVA
ncbi:MAG: amino acid adenylation domain-containing protein [Lautropia sp.]|nr:amino acid adenylation domain-containing protein [Lautropia sp.]